MHKLQPEEYKKLLKAKIMKTCKKSNCKKVNAVKNKAKKITEKLSISDSFQKLQDEAYIKIKDHKAEFPYKLYCSLIASYKSIARISKVILDKLDM